MYTKSLRTCPLSFAKDRAIFHSNRSVCYLKMVKILNHFILGFNW